MPVDPRYVNGEVAGYVTTGKWGNQAHLTAESTEAAASFTVYAVLWPERNGAPATPVAAKLDPIGRLIIARPDGKTDTLTLTDEALTLK